MPPPKSVSPLEALRIVTTELPSLRVESLALDSAAGSRRRYLAQGIESLPPRSGFPADPPNLRRAVSDGYAVSRAVESSHELEVLGYVDVTGSWPQIDWRKGVAVRVECGAPLVEDVACVVPVAAVTVVGTQRVRVARPVDGGEGIAGGHPAERCQVIAAGASVSPRLRAFLFASGIQSVNVFCGLRVGVLSIGDELTDSGPPYHADERPDGTGLWLSETLERDGLTVVPLGIVSDEPGAIRDVLLRSRSRKIDVVVLAGGLGDGISDRTAEALKLFDTRLFFERLELDGCERFLFAKSNGIDVFGLSGMPLAATVAYDLWVRPALLARLGAGRALWDWSRVSLPLENPAVCRPSGSDDTWRILAACRVAPPPSPSPSPSAHPPPSAHLDSDGPPCVRAWEPASPFTPWVPGATGWALIPPGAGPPARVYNPPIAGLR